MGRSTRWLSRFGGPLETGPRNPAAVVLGGNWASVLGEIIFVLSHGVAHRVLGHDTPDGPRQQELELEADACAGALLRQGLQSRLMAGRPRKALLGIYLTLMTMHSRKRGACISTPKTHPPGGTAGRQQPRAGRTPTRYGMKAHCSATSCRGGQESATGSPSRGGKRCTFARTGRLTCVQPLRTQPQHISTKSGAPEVAIFKKI